jgi:hypothetical protein
MVLPYSAKDTILRPLDRHLEPGVRAAHSKSGKTDGLSELLDQLDGLLAALGVSAARPETVISDRLVHQYLYRLSDCRERIMSHEQNVDARRTMARAPALPNGAGERKRYVSRPLVCRGGSPTMTALRRDGASSRASSASVGSFIAGSSGSSQEGDDAGEQTVIEHEAL